MRRRGDGDIVFLLRRRAESLVLVVAITQNSPPKTTGARAAPWAPNNMTYCDVAPNYPLRNSLACSGQHSGRLHCIFFLSVQSVCRSGTKITVHALMGVDGICIAFAFCGPLRRGRFLLPIIFVWVACRAFGSINAKRVVPVSAPKCAFVRAATAD